MTESWTRVSTVARTLADTYGLEKWAKRNVAIGIAARPDLYALATSYDPEDKEALNRLVEDAETAAKSRSAANLGTALHRMTDRIDRGLDIDVPEAWKPDIDAYCAALVDNHITIHPEWIERVVVVASKQIAGTFDRIVTIDGTRYIADLKTGKDAPQYPHDIAIQLAIYANASHMWKGSAEDADNNRDRWGRYLLPAYDEADQYEPMPEVDKTKALIIHLPVDQARCTLHWVDIEAGREAAGLALVVRDWRKRKDLSYPMAKGEPAPITTDDDW